jgi:hypothetical protein
MGCKFYCRTRTRISHLKLKVMLPFSHFLQSLFSENYPKATQVQTALEPIHEENITLGVEFLDDLTTPDDTTEEETK